MVTTLPPILIHVKTQNYAFHCPKTRKISKTSVQCSFAPILHVSRFIVSRFVCFVLSRNTTKQRKNVELCNSMLKNRKIPETSVQGPPPHTCIVPRADSLYSHTYNTKDKNRLNILTLLVPLSYLNKFICIVVIPSPVLTRGLS